MEKFAKTVNEDFMTLYSQYLLNKDSEAFYSLPINEMEQLSKLGHKDATIFWYKNKSVNCKNPQIDKEIDEIYEITSSESMAKAYKSYAENKDQIDALKNKAIEFIINEQQLINQLTPFSSIPTENEAKLKIAKTEFGALYQKSISQARKEARQAKKEGNLLPQVKFLDYIRLEPLITTESRIFDPKVNKVVDSLYNALEQDPNNNELKFALGKLLYNYGKDDTKEMGENLLNELANREFININVNEKNQ